MDIYIPSYQQWKFRSRLLNADTKLQNVSSPSALYNHITTTISCIEYHKACPNSRSLVLTFIPKTEMLSDDFGVCGDKWTPAWYLQHSGNLSNESWYHRNMNKDLVEFEVFSRPGEIYTTDTDRSGDWFLAATKQLYEWFSPSACPSVRLSVCLSHLFDYVPIIVSSWNFQELLPMTEVHAKDQSQMSRVKVTEVNIQLSRFRTLTPVWLHVWWWNDAQSLMLHYCFFKVIRQISRTQG